MMKIAFYPASARWRVTGFEALCDRGSFARYVAGASGPLVFREGFFLYAMPSEAPGQLVTLSPEEKRRLRPRFSEVLLVNYSLLDGSMLLWEDGQSVLKKLFFAERAGLTEALVPEAFREALPVPAPRPGSSPSRYRGG